MTPERVRVVIVDDHPIFRIGLSRALSGTPLEVVAEAETAAEAREVVLATKPDVVLLDIVLPDGDGLSVCRHIKRQLPETAVVMLSSFDDVATVRASREAGASAHLSKDTPASEIVAQALRLMAEPTATIFPRMRVSGMTERELDVLERLALGWTYAAIAEHLGLSPETVKSYLREAYGKLGVRDRAAAIAEGRRRGFLPRPPGLGVPEGNRDG